MLGDLAPGAHVGQLYRDQDDLLETLVPFFAAGLADHERCIWVTASPLCAADARSALARIVPDLAERERRKQIEIVDHADWYARTGLVSPSQILDGWLEAEEDALRAGYSALRISGNTYWLEPESWQAFAEYEEMVHGAFQGRKIVALCSYCLGKCESSQVVDVLRNHSVSLVRGHAGWEVVHGATAALASLEPEADFVEQPDIPQRNSEVDCLRAELAQATAALAAAREQREQLVRLDRLAAALGEVTTRLELVQIATDLVASTLEVDGMVLMEHTDGDPDLLVGHGVAVDALRQLAHTWGTRTIWSHEPHAFTLPEPLRSVAILPLVAGGVRRGSCALGFTTPHELTASYRALAQDVVRQMALALDRSMTYERLEHERERAELASRAKDEFLAMLGHELRNPLSPILTATQLMRLRSSDNHERERVVIERQCKHMVRLVDDLLDVSRITRGKVELRRRAIELSEIVEQAVEMSSPAFEERHHKLTLDVPDTGVVVHADAQRLAQVLANLLTNAAKYTPAGGEVRLSVHASVSKVELTVKDNGIGIDPKLLPHIFELFVQGRQGIDRASGGLGLGLAIAKSLLEMHGGSIRVQSEGANKGSEFTLELPRFANTRPSRSNMSGPFALPTVRGRRVLVVDDNEDAAYLFSEALKRLGHQVDVAYDGPSALERAREHLPEIAFLDIGLPVMDGYELGRRLRDLGGEHAPRLVAVTGYGHTSDRERSRDAGFDLHLVKPIELAAVQDAIARFES